MKLLLIALAVFTIARAAPGSRPSLSTPRDSLGDALQKAEEYLQSLKPIFDEVSAKVNKTADVYVDNARRTNAEFAALLHAQIERAAKYYEQFGVDVKSCRSGEKGIDRVLDVVLRETILHQEVWSESIPQIFQLEFKKAGRIARNARSEAERCDKLGSEDATMKCRNELLKQFRLDFTKVTVSITKEINSGNSLALTFNNHYPIPEFVSLTKYRETASKIVWNAIQCMASKK